MNAIPNPFPGSRSSMSSEALIMHALLSSVHQAAASRKMQLGRHARRRKYQNLLPSNTHSTHTHTQNNSKNMQSTQNNSENIQKEISTPGEYSRSSERRRCTPCRCVAIHPPGRRVGPTTREGAQHQFCRHHPSDPSLPSRPTIKCLQFFLPVTTHGPINEDHCPQLIAS